MSVPISWLGQHPVEARALHVQDLAPERQHRLVVTGASLFGRSAGTVALDEEELGLGRVLLLAVGELAGQRGHVHRRLAPRQFARLARRLPRQRRLDDLADDQAGLLRVLLEPLAELLVHQVLDRRAHLGRHELVFGLAGEFRVGHLDRQDAGQPLARVVAREGHLLPLRDAGGIRIVVDRPGQRAAEPREMRAPVALRDVVGEGQHHLVVTVVPPHRDLDADAVALARDVDRVGDHRRLGAVEVLHELAHSALVLHLDAQRLGVAQVLQHDLDAGIQERELPQAVLERLEAVVEVGEGRGGGEEAHFRALLAGGFAHDAQMFHRVAALEAGIMLLAVAPDPEVEPVAERVHHRHAHAVQPARDLVGVLVELTARVQLGHDDLGRADALPLWISTGMPRPLSRTDTLSSGWSVTVTASAWPASASSMPLSTTS
jgi:hypothetical protein